MILLAGADLVLPDRVLQGGSLLIDAGRVRAIEPDTIETPDGAQRVDATGMLVVPGFIDVHVHGVEGQDVLDGTGAIASLAARLPRYGVTAFCPTSIACPPDRLAVMLAEVEILLGNATQTVARVLPAHLESNFINPEYKGAQPAECLRAARPRNAAVTAPRTSGHEPFSGEEILDTIARHREAVGIVTVAPELDGGLDLVRELTSAGHRVSIGHSGATYEQTAVAIDAGVCHATHLFNRMSPLGHRSPGVAGAVLRDDRVVCELICDGFHVHPALMELAVRIKGPSGIMAITDGTAGSGLAAGCRTRLGGRPIVVTELCATLEDGTLAGSVLTMDGAFRRLVKELGFSVGDAARMCATTPAEALGLDDQGRIAVGSRADLTVLDQALTVQSTYVGGQLWRNPPERPLV